MGRITREFAENFKNCNFCSLYEKIITLPFFNIYQHFYLSCSIMNSYRNIFNFMNIMEVYKKK